jgi:hypothetical protein
LSEHNIHFLTDHFFSYQNAIFADFIGQMMNIIHITAFLLDW